MRSTSRGRGLRSLRMRLALYVGCCVAFSITLVCSVIGWRAQHASESAALTLANEAARRAASTVEADLRATFQIVRTLQLGLAAVHQQQGQIDRAQLDALLRSGLQASPDWMAFYSVWEPNALDGRDHDFAGRGPGTDASGRFLSWWNRLSGDVSLRAVEFSDTPGADEWYHVPCRTRRDTWTDLAPFMVQGKPVLTTTVASPIVIGDRCLGVVAADVDLAALQRKLQAMVLPMQMQLALLSQRGAYVSHPQTAVLGQLAQTLPASVLADIAAGREARWDVSDAVHLFIPVRIGQDLPVWSVEVWVPTGQMLAAGLRMVQWAAVVGGIALIAALAMLFVTVTRSMAPLQRLATTLEGLSAEDGQINRTLPVQGPEELARISAAFNAFVQRLCSAFSAVAAASSQVDVAAGEIVNGNDDLARRTERQAACLQGVAGAVRSLSDGIQGNAASAREAARLSNEVQRAVQHTEATMTVARASMNALTETARKVNEITGVIDGLAGQTNILALNAAVESARAGDVGRGFAVVANEVRQLSLQSARAARDIRTLIEEAVRHIAQSQQQMVMADMQVRSLSGVVEAVAERVDSIDKVCTQQAHDTVGVGDAVTHLDAMTQQNAALVEQAAAASNALHQQTDRLFSTVRQYIHSP